MAGTAPAPPPIGGAAGGSNAGAGGTTVACNLQHAKGALKLDLMSGGVARKVRLFVPAAYDGSKPLPLVLNLHGSGDNADNFAKSTQMESLADSEGFLVAGLEALAGEWNTPPDAGKPDDVAYAGDAIDLVMKTVCTDDKRVYASGFSGGARTTSQLGCKLPERITAIVPVAGVRWPAPCAGRPVPVLAIHGLADTENMYAGEGPTHPKWNESVEDAIEGWATKNGCNQARVVDDPAGAVSIYRYGQCQADATVKLLRMDGVGHAYPTGTPIHAAKKAWSFLKAFARP
jgi:polyhydroxybutyrate depolymerase